VRVVINSRRGDVAPNQYEEKRTMNDTDTRRYAMFGRVDSFGRTNAADFQPDSEAGKRFATLGGIIHDLDSAKARQKPGRATVKQTLLEALRSDILNIVRTARAIAMDDPGFADGFYAPESAGQTVLLTTADAMLLELNKPGVAAKFVAHELPADFIQQLSDRCQAIASAQDAMESNDCAGVSSTAAISRLIRAGMKEVAFLDAIIHNKYAQNTDQLRAWLSASTVERPTRRQKKAASSPTAGTVPAVPASSNPDAA
jgi:hypothetical protein